MDHQGSPITQILASFYQPPSTSPLPQPYSSLAPLLSLSSTACHSLRTSFQTQLRKPSDHQLPDSTASTLQHSKIPLQTGRNKKNLESFPGKQVGIHMWAKSEHTQHATSWCWDERAGHASALPGCRALGLFKCKCPLWQPWPLLQGWQPPWEER